MFLVLVVLLPECCDCLGVTVRVRGQHPGPGAHLHPRELRPVLLVVVDDQRHSRVRLDVADPLEVRRLLGFLVDGRDDSLADERIADGHGVGLSRRVGSGESAHACSFEKRALGVCVHAR